MEGPVSSLLAAKVTSPLTFGQPRGKKQAGKPKLTIADLMHTTEDNAALDLTTDKHISHS